MRDERGKEVKRKKLAKLAGDMEHAAIRLPVLLAHSEAAVHNAEELRGAAACVKRWAERLRA